LVEVRPAETEDERREAPPVGPSEVPPDWAEPAPDRPVPFWASIAQDLNAHLPEGRRGGAIAVWVARRLLIAARSSGLHMTLLYRVAHQAQHRFGIPGRIVAGMIFWSIRHSYSCSIASTARIYGGLILPHPQGIVIGPESVIGPRAWIYQNVTVGGVPGKDGMPRIGRDARLYTGAVVVGPIVVGDNVLVGANAVVGSDVPSYRAVRSPMADVAPLPDRCVVHLS
jgi:serine O-acetyltransferase